MIPCVGCFFSGRETARPSRACRVSGGVVIPTVSTVGGGGRATVRNRAKVAFLVTCGIWAAVLRLMVVEGTNRAARVIVFADRGYVAVSLTVAASSSLVGRVGGFDLSLARQKKDVRTHPLTILGAGCDNNRGGKFQRAGFRIRVEEAGRGDFEPLCVEYGSLEVHEESLIILWEISEGEAMDGELVLVGGGPERDPWGGADWKGFV